MGTARTARADGRGALPVGYRVRERVAIAASALSAALTLFGCQDEFPLGAWDLPPSGNAGSAAATAGTTGAAGSSDSGGAAGTGVMLRPSPTCGEVGTPGALNAAGIGRNSIGTTNLYTSWTWPANAESLEWDLVIETDPVTDGYYWAHQFSFVNGVTGFVGLQAHGGYQTTLTEKPSFVKMALFWVGGGARPAELGDIQDPDARTLVVSGPGVEWTTINAKYEWNACDVYRLRLAKDGTDSSDNIWYGAWIDDRTTRTLTFLGRIAVPPEWGQLSLLSTSITTRIDDKPGPAVTTCDVPEPASAIFGTPTANEGQLVPKHTNSFIDPPRCPTSRFTELPEGVRHEIALRPPP